jgi:hypothetical protein
MNLPEIKIIDNSASRRDQRRLYRTLSAAPREFFEQKFSQLDQDEQKGFARGMSFGNFVHYAIPNPYK